MFVRRNGFQAPVPRAVTVTPYGSGVSLHSLSQAQANLLKAAGIHYVRIDVSLTSAAFQNVYSLAASNGLSVIGILDFYLVNSNQSFTLNDWRIAVTNAVNAYPAISVWEVWNEPTQAKYQFGYMDGSPQHYYDILKVSYQAVKAKNPNAVVLALGGAQFTPHLDYPFAQQVWGLGAANYSDAISIHPYPYQLNIGRTWSYYENDWTTELARYRSFNRPIWITETGLQSTQNNETDQASYLQESYNFFKQQNVSEYTWYDLIDSGDSWGLLRANSTIKPAYTTYLNLLHAEPISTSAVTTSAAIQYYAGVIQNIPTRTGISLSNPYLPLTIGEVVTLTNEVCAPALLLQHQDGASTHPENTHASGQRALSAVLLQVCPFAPLFLNSP